MADYRKMIKQIKNTFPDSGIKMTDIISKHSSNNSKAQPHPISLKEFYVRIEESERDIRTGNTLSHEQLKKEITHWDKS